MKSTKEQYFLITQQNIVNEQFKGEITEEQNNKFDKEYGQQHPFNFKTTQGVYEKVGQCTGAVDKYVDYIIGPGFYVTSDDKKCEEVIDQFIEDTNFDNHLRKWVKQAIIKGNSPLELGGSKNDTVKGLKTLNADSIYVKRNKQGEVEKYNQVIIEKGGKRIISFEPWQIAMLQFNVPDDNTYGIGILYPCLNIINNILSCEKDMHTLIKRKANSPIHVQLGNYDKDDIPTADEVTNFGSKLEYLQAKTEWATGPNVNMKVIDFGNVSDKFTSVLEYDEHTLFYSLQIPEVLMGKGSIPEGLAQVQMDGFMRRVQSFQSEIEKIIETQIFARVLASQGLQEHVEFGWGTPSLQETNTRITQITTLLSNPSLSPNLVQALQEELAELMEIDVVIDTPKQEQNADETTSQPEVPGQQRQMVEKIYEGELLL